MTDLEAIEVRASRRAYSGQLSAGQMRQLEDQIALCNLYSGLSVRLLPDGSEAFGGVTKSYGMFSGVHALYTLAGPANEPNLLEGVGHAGEYLVLQATKMGLGTCWVGGTFDRARLTRELPGSHELVAVITVGPVKDSRGFFEKTVSRVAVGKRKTAQQMMELGAEAPDWFVAGVEAAARAPSAMNRQPVAFGWDGEKATAGVTGTEGFNLVDLGIAKYHFEVGAGGRFEYGNGAAFAKDN